MDRVARIAMIARWKPVHLGHAAVLEALTEVAVHVIVGIGSSNRYDAANPFTAVESADMIRLVLPDRSNFDIVDVPDLGHGPRWRAMVVEMLGPLDVFVTANGYVRDLLAADYRVVHPATLVARDRHVAVSATMVRRRMAQNENWQELVPAVVAGYLTENGLVNRFRREFGADYADLEPRTEPGQEDH